MSTSDLSWLTVGDQVGAMLGPTGQGSAASADPSSGYAAAAGILQVFGILNTMVGSFYAADAARTQAKSEALDMEFRSSMAARNARQAERDAQQILRASEQEIGMRTEAAGAAKASAAAAMAGRGVRLGVGSAAEVAASIELAKELDVLTINSNAARAAGNARMQGQNYRTESAMARVSAQNLRGTARTIDPYATAAAAGVSSAAQVAPYWYAWARRSG